MRLSHRGILASSGAIEDLVLTYFRVSADPLVYEYTVLKVPDMTPIVTTLDNNQRYLGFDVERDLFMFGSGTTITERDKALNLIRTVQVGYSTNGYLIFYKNGKYYQVRWASPKFSIYDITGTSNTLVYTSVVTSVAYGIAGVSVDNKKNYLYIKLTGSGSPSPLSFIVNISNMGSITEQVFGNSSKGMYGVFVGKNEIIIGRTEYIADKFFAVIEERSLNYDTLIKTVTTQLTADIGTYVTRYPVGKDKDGCYYATQWNTLSSNTVISYKIAPDGSIIFSAGWFDGYSTFTSEQRLISGTGNKVISLLSNHDGSIVKSYNSSRTIPKIYSLWAGNFIINKALS
jgi:hypothetical protein